MARALPILGAAAVAAAAQPTTTSLFLPADAETIFGSIVHAEASATTFVVTCAGKNCDWDKPATITQGPSTWAQVYTVHQTVVDDRCLMHWDDNYGDCNLTMIYEGRTLTDAQRIPKVSDDLHLVTLTTGTSGTASAMPSTVDATSTGGVQPTDAADSGSGAGDSCASTTTSPNAAFPMMTRSPVIAGVAVMIGGAMAF